MVVTMDEIERLREFARMYANCPCCDEYRKCVEDCTFAEDCPQDVDTMRAARYALYGDDVDAPKEGE